MTIIPFTPNNNISPPFSALFTLDGNQYSGAAAWNVYAQRWYLTLTDQSNNRIWTGPIIGSTSTFSIPLAPGIFTSSTLIFNEDTGNFEQTP